MTEIVKARRLVTGTGESYYGYDKNSHLQWPAQAYRFSMRHKRHDQSPTPHRFGVHTSRSRHTHLDRVRDQGEQSAGNHDPDADPNPHH